MDIPDIAPISYFSEFYQIPVEIIALIIFLAGYFTVRIAQKNQALSKTMDSLDVIFILAVSGMTWFLRIALSLFWVNAFVITYLTDPETIQELGNVAVIYIYGLIVFICLSSWIDIRVIRHKQPLKRKPSKQHNYQIINRWNKWFEKQRFRFIIGLSIFFAGFLSFGFFAHEIDYIGLSLFYLFMMLFAVVPSITLLFKMMNTLLQKKNS